LKSLLVFIRILVVGGLWGIVFTEGIRVIMLCNWHFDIFWPDHWRQAKELWQAGWVVRAPKEWAFVIILVTFFPMLIVVCAALGGSEKLHKLLAFGEKIVSESVMEFIRNFLVYVDNSNRSLMVPLAFVVLISYTSAAFRSVYATVGLIQGGAEHRGIKAYLFSLVYSLVLIALMYFSVLVMTSGELVLELLNEYVFLMEFLHDWLYGCYVLMVTILFILLVMLYHTPKRRCDKYSVMPGALFSSLAIF
jgi:uncharacterized BrkB/YihY/UPF0761 family membrane protein